MARFGSKETFTDHDLFYEREKEPEADPPAPAGVAEKNGLMPLASSNPWRTPDPWSGPDGFRR